MGNVLVVVEAHDGKLRTASLPAITFGKQMAEKAGGTFSLLIAGKGVAGAAEEAAKFGAAEVLVADDAKLEHYLAETYAPIVAKAAKDKGATVVRLLRPHRGVSVTVWVVVECAAAGVKGSEYVVPRSQSGNWSMYHGLETLPD